MIRIARAFPSNKSLCAGFFPCTLALDVQRNGVAAAIGFDVSHFHFAGIVRNGYIIVVANKFRTTRRLDCKANAIKAKAIVVPDLYRELSRAIWVAVRGNRYVNLRHHVRVRAPFLTAIKSIVDDRHDQADCRDNVRKLASPKKLECFRKRRQFPFPHGLDSPVFSHSHEAMRHGGWQARRFFRRWRGVSIPALLPP